MGDSKRESSHSYPANHLYGKKGRSKLGDVHKNLTFGNRHLYFLNYFFGKVAGPIINAHLTIFRRLNELLMSDDEFTLLSNIAFHFSISLFECLYHSCYKQHFAGT